MSTKIMAFDQTLANCGWVSVLVNEGELYPIESGTIKGQWLDAGMLEPVREAVALRELASAFMVRQNPSLVLVELPPIRRPGMERESSLLACTAVMMAAADHGLTVVGVSAQQAKRRLTGFANAKKPQVRLAVQERWPEYKTLLTNEHTRDAWVLAWEWWTNGRS